MIKMKNKYRKGLQNNYDTNLKNELKQLQKEINVLINSTKTDSWEKYSRNLTSKNGLWNIFRNNKSDQKFGISTLHGPGGLIFDNESKAEHLADTYQKIHRSTEFMSDRRTRNTVNSVVNQLEC
ncbi:hypothetical protein WA026_007552 [Henosepilachna vigintioctopunctata]|uniref:Uncharacterized protein n=1 Tax=Henosepilachna vigintioctopunctata TaxID=420089 RepID=A0AAW1UW56_9CUCU